MSKDLFPLRLTKGQLHPFDPEFEVNILIGALIVSLTVRQEWLLVLKGSSWEGNC